MEDSSGKRSVPTSPLLPLSLALSTLIDRQTNGKRNVIPEICILLMPTEQRTDAQIPSIMWGEESKKEIEIRIHTVNTAAATVEREKESVSDIVRKLV